MVLTGLIALVLIMGGIMKIAGAEPEQVMEFLTKSGFGPYIVLLGVTELVIAAALLYPRTSKIGFLLACSYFGGALCLELSGGQPPVSVVFLVILWVGMFLRKREMFFE